jgi:hemolysin activation/secretion protein
LPPKGGAVVLLRSVTYDPPSAFLSAAELNAISAKYVGRRVDFSDISALVREVNDLYAKKGVVTAGAILPPQNLSSGQLTVKLVEGREGTVSVVGEHRTRNDLIFQAVRLTRDGNIVDVPTASSDIARFNKMHHAQLSLLLQPGATFGLTDLTIGVREPPPDLFQLSLDNQGVASTGETQFSALYQKYGLFGIDDQIMVLGTATPGSLAGTANFDLPISSFGTRLALGATASTIKVVAGPTAALDITGGSRAVTATVTQAIYVNPAFSAIGLGTVSYGTSQSYASGTPLVDSTVTKAALGIALGYTNERFSLGAQPQLIYAMVDDHLFSTRRGIVLLAGSASAQATITDALSWTSHGAWQYTQEKLLPGSLLFQIGGFDSVRGYPSDGVGGDSGFFIQNELHWLRSGQVGGIDLYALADFGQVYSTFPAITTMASLGAGWTASLSDRATLDVSAAVPIIPAVAGQPSLAAYAKLTGSFR